VPAGRSWIVPLVLAAGCGDRPQAVAPPEDVHHEGLHNVLAVGDGLLSGSSPEGDAGFDSLQALGVKTVISVDGAPPDVAAARDRGMRYVHIPVGYGGITREQAVLLCKAATELPGPIYVHCHHGKHRGPAACVLIRLARGGWSADEALAFLKSAGTDPRYEGLYANAREFTPPTEAELRACPSIFPERVDVGGLAARMVEIDEVWDRIKKKPEAAEVVQLVEHYRESARLPETERRGARFKSVLADAAAAARDLEGALRTGNDAARKAAFDRSAGLCTSCHREFRDRPRK
jgi:protein tyrosine phosphatase (PTP) superfamily phosphohydrolase (DUF442 family)